jgi:predicted ribosomally synthesized peptide with nif11-like leader
MSEEYLKAFLEAIKADASLQEKLKAASDLDSVVSFANARGFMVSVEDLNNAQLEITEVELDGVAGGVCDWIVPFASQKVL